MSDEGPRKNCSRNGEYGDDERTCRRANVDEMWIDSLPETTHQRHAHLPGDASVCVEYGYTLAAATLTETSEADANGHDVSAHDGNSNANGNVGTILDKFHATMGRLPSLEEHNDIRVQNAERTIAPGTMRNAISKWNREHLNDKTLGALIQEFYAKTNSLPTLVQCNDIRIQNGQRIIAASSLSYAISKWNREHSNAKTVGALIHDCGSPPERP